MTITDHPEFKEIMMDAYAKAYKHGQDDACDQDLGCANVLQRSWMGPPFTPLFG